MSYATTVGCLDEHEVLELAEGRVERGSLRRIELHLDECETCFRLVAAFSREPAPAPPPAITQLRSDLLEAETVAEGLLPRRGAERRIPATLGGYQLLATLGRGGMGVVYRGRSPDGAIVAVKTVLAANPMALAAVRREAALLRRIAHPGVVRLLDQGTEDGRPWFAMELLEGATLATWLLEGPRPRAQLLDVLRKLAETLAALHGKGVVHGDLTPRNILLRADGSPVVVDFGLACELAGAGRETWSASAPTGGTPAYIAPEQASGLELDARADLYSFGCLVYECLTGAPPFTGERDDILRRHLAEIPPPPSQRARDLPPALDELCAALLAKQPRARPAYALDVVDRLAALGAAGWPALARPPRPYVYRPRLAGRHAPLQILDELIEQCGAGRGAVVLVAGPSGAGKTRLVAEVAARARRAGLAISGGRAMPLGDEDAARLPAAALHPLRPLFQDLVDRCTFAGPAARDVCLGADAAVLAACVPELRPPGAPPPDEPVLEGPAAKARLIRAVEDVLVRMAVGQPLLIVLDDMQWADELTLAVLGSVARRLADQPILVVATCRDDAIAARPFHDAMAAGAIYLELRELDPPSVEHVVADMLAVERAPASIAARVEEECGGNPLYIAEHLRALVAEGLLQRTGGAWAVVEPAGGAEARVRGLPALVERRLARLSPAARGVAELAAVLVAPVLDPALLAAIAQLTDAGLADALGELVEASVLDEDGARYRFLHDRLRALAYARIAPARRLALHAAAAAALEARDGDAPVIAHHYLRAGRPELALRYLERSADAALAAAACGEAARLYREVIAAEADAVHGGYPAAPAHRRARWERRLGEACYALGDLAGCAEHSQRALAGFGHPLPIDRAGWLRALGTEVVRKLLRPRRERDPVRRRDLAEAAGAAARITHAYFFREDLVPVVACSLRAVNLAARVGPVRGMARPYAQLAYLAGMARLRGLGGRLYETALDGARALDDPEETALALYHQAAHLVGLARWDVAEQLGREAADLLARVDAPQEREIVETILAYAEYATGRYGDARARCRRVRAQARARRNAQHEAWGLYTIARCALAEDRPAEAIELLGEALPLVSGAGGDVASEILGLGLAAAAHARAGELDTAVVRARTAGAHLAGRMPAVFTHAEAYAGLAEAWLAAQAAGVAGSAGPAAAALARLGAFATIFPIGRPALLWLTGRAARLRGLHPIAALATRRAAALAGDMQLADLARRAGREEDSP